MVTSKVHAPAHLREPTKRWWRSVVKDYDLAPHHTRLLTAAAESWDRLQQAREALAKYGLTYDDPKSGAPRSRPEIAVERDSRIAFARLLRELDLDGEPEPTSRPPRVP
jgi:phage terminase small subunit